MQVPNQPPPLENYNVFTCDPVLVEGLRRECAAWAEPRAIAFGERMGSEAAIRWGFQANEYPPVPRTHDRYGNRIDEVEFHPAWHELMRLSISHGLHNLPWTSSQPGAHVARAALMYLASQNEQGHTCPVSMTSSAWPAIRDEPGVAAEWGPLIQSVEYDPRFRPAAEKAGALIGMAMTERQGGSDVRANTTRAVPDNGEYRITGHKWFCSAPMCDAFLVLAQAPGGLTCFLMPRWTPDGERNGFRIERLKTKLGNRSNASSEVAFENAWARRIGEEGRGVAQIIEMVQHTRLDCVIGSAGLIRQALVQALHHARRRAAFGRLLADQPLMTNVLADLALESEAATLLMLRLARAFDRRSEDEGERGIARLATAAAKFWVCKRAGPAVGEALECLGGNGYVEECVMPRLYREAPLNSIWEGSGNVICLDVLRAIRKDPAAVEAVIEEIGLARGMDRGLDAFARGIQKRLLEASEDGARRLTEDLALALQASLILRHSPASVAGAFCRTRISGDWGRTFGTLPPGVDVKHIVDRAAAATLPATM